MPVMKRRRFLSVVAACATIAGCPEREINPTLRLCNETAESVVLDITVFIDEPGPETQRKSFYTETVSVGETTTEELEVFTRREQYDVIIEVDDRDVQFDTRPICPDSLTEVIVTEAGALRYEVEFCDGVRRTGTAT